MESTRTATDMQILAESLGNLPEATATPALIVVSGLPGTGKSYFCRNVIETIVRAVQR